MAMRIGTLSKDFKITLFTELLCEQSMGRRETISFGKSRQDAVGSL